jgi:hypothetical protein
MRPAHKLAPEIVEIFLVVCPAKGREFLDPPWLRLYRSVELLPKLDILDCRHTHHPKTIRLKMQRAVLG